MIRTAESAGPEPVRAALRVGLIIDGYHQPRWVRRMIERVRDSPHAQLVLVANVAGGAVPGFPSGATVAVDHDRSGLYSLIARVDRWRQRRWIDPLGIVPIEDLFGDVQHVRVGPNSTGSEPEVAGLVEALRGHDLDVVVCPGPEPPPSLPVARHGLWYYRHSHDDAESGRPPGLREVVAGEPVIASALWATSAAGPRCLYRSISRTDRLSVAATMRTSYWKGALFVARALRDLHLAGPVAEPCDPDAGSRADAGNVGTRSGASRDHGPAARESLALVAAIGGRWLRNRIDRATTRDQWLMAYQPEPLGGPARLPAPDPERLIRLRPPPDRIWADPFPVRIGDRHVILFEELPDSTGKGHIAAMEIAADGRIGEPDIVLAHDYHLAYPFHFQWNGAHFMIPETADNRTIELYRADRFPGDWTLEHVLLSDVWAADTTLVEHAGRWWMFTSIGEPGHFDCDGELHVFHAPSPTGPWTPHRRNPIKSDVRSARGAGRFIRIGEKLFRPAQDCARRYGHAIVLHAVLELDELTYREVPVARIEPTWTPGLLGTHTINTAPGLTIFDGLYRDRRLRRVRRTAGTRPEIGSPEPAKNELTRAPSEAPFHS